MALLAAQPLFPLFPFDGFCPPASAVERAEKAWAGQKRKALAQAVVDSLYATGLFDGWEWSQSNELCGRPVSEPMDVFRHRHEDGVVESVYLSPGTAEMLSDLLSDLDWSKPSELFDLEELTNMLTDSQFDKFMEMVKDRFNAVDRDIKEVKADLKELPTKDYMRNVCITLAATAFVLGQGVSHWEVIAKFLHFG